jgi:hypothetical protein
MKQLRLYLAATVLALTLSVPAFAGDMWAGITAPPPPPQQTSATGDMGTPGETATGEISTPGVVALDPVTEAALGLLKSLLSLF